MNKDVIKNIAETRYKTRAAIQRLAQIHVDALCNGDYYEDEETGQWIGYNHQTFTHDNIQAAKLGERREKALEQAIKAMCGTDDIPNFVTYSGDPRGLVVKIKTDHMTEAEKEYCRELGFVMDWGNDFSIIKNQENMPAISDHDRSTLDSI